MIPDNCSDCTTFLLGEDTGLCINNTHPEYCKQKQIWADEVKMKPLTGNQVNRLLFHEGEDSIEERGNKDDGYEVYRHDTRHLPPVGGLEVVRECLKQVLAQEGDED